MRTIVYVDGFNLYYRDLRKSRHKWLNLLALSQAALPKTCNIAAIHYYTARSQAAGSSPGPNYL